MVKNRQFLASDNKSTHTASAYHCTCTGYKYRRKCKHQQFMAHKHKRDEVATPEFVDLFFRLV